MIVEPHGSKDEKGSPGDLGGILLIISGYIHFRTTKQVTFSCFSGYVVSSPETVFMLKSKYITFDSLYSSNVNSL